MSTPRLDAPIGLEPSARQVRDMVTAAVEYVLRVCDRSRQARASHDRARVAAVLGDAVVPWPPAAGCSLAELLAALDRTATR